MENKTIIDSNNAITHDTVEYKELVEIMRFVMQTANKLVAEVEPSLFGERYLTTEQIMTYLHISRRTLQNYRDRGVIPYTAINGTLLYPESKIKEILEKNYYKPVGEEESN